jgi:hypothetical protein
MVRLLNYGYKLHRQYLLKIFRHGHLSLSSGMFRASDHGAKTLRAQVSEQRLFCCERKALEKRFLLEFALTQFC